MYKSNQHEKILYYKKLIVEKEEIEKRMAEENNWVWKENSQIS